MIPVPWTYINSWRCTGCGICCKKYEVVLKFNEWLKLVQLYGAGVTSADINKFYLGKRADGSCIFLILSNGVHFCGLQNMKPVACKLWPFKILDRPRYGIASEAAFDYQGHRLYIYVDPFCPEILYGHPSAVLLHKIIPEFIEIALGVREKQYYSTSTPLYDMHLKTKQNYRLI